MAEAIVLEEQKGLWIEERLLRQAHLGERLRVVVRAGEIRILAAATTSALFPYGVTDNEARHIRAPGLCRGRAPFDLAHGDAWSRRYCWWTRACPERERRVLAVGDTAF
jgi:hypothetical protein